MVHFETSEQTKKALECLKVSPFWAELSNHHPFNGEEIRPEDEPRIAGTLLNLKIITDAGLYPAYFETVLGDVGKIQDKMVARVVARFFTWLCYLEGQCFLINLRKLGEGKLLEVEVQGCWRHYAEKYPGILKSILTGDGGIFPWEIEHATLDTILGWFTTEKGHGALGAITTICLAI